MTMAITPTRRPLARRLFSPAYCHWLRLRIWMKQHDVAAWELAIATAHVFEGTSEAVDAYTDELHRRVEAAERFITAATLRLLVAERA